MVIVNDQLTFADELCTEINKRKIKGYYLTDNQLILQVENSDGRIINTSLMYTNENQAYQDYVTLVNLNSFSTSIPRQGKPQ